MRVAVQEDGDRLDVAARQVDELEAFADVVLLLAEVSECTPLLRAKMTYCGR